LAEAVVRLLQQLDSPAVKVEPELAVVDHGHLQQVATVATVATVEQTPAAQVVLELTLDQQAAAQVATVATVQRASSS
jgi:hypothetical protein